MTTSNSNGEIVNGTKSQAYYYLLPRDAPEAKRLDTQHEIFRITFSGNLFFSPITLDQPKCRVLDLGCGTSSWGIEIAEKNPSTMIIGIDLGQPQPDYKPPNYTYLQDNFEKSWPFDSSDPQQKFDFIHHRFVLVSMRNHNAYIAQAFEHLKPGGYFEIQDFELPFKTSTPKYTRWSDDLDTAQKAQGIDMQAANKWDGWLAAAGFVDIEHKYFDWPIGVREEDAARGDERLVRVGEEMMVNMTVGMKGFSNAAYTKYYGWSEEKLDSLLEEVKLELRQNPGKNVMPLHVVYGRKPEA